MKILRKIKDRIKRAIQKSTSKIKASYRQEKKRIDKENRETKNNFLGAYETRVEKEKFSHPESVRLRRHLPQEMPERYEEDRLVLQVRDPWWIHSYWELSSLTLEKTKKELGSDFYSAKRLLRVYDVTNIIFNGGNANSFFDIEINDNASSWYIDTKNPGRSWCVDFGLLLSSGRFVTLLRSNTVQTPLDGPSWITDEEWMIPDDMFARLYGMGFGLGKSSPVGKAWQERVKREVLSSPGITSGASPVKIKTEQGFWLIVNCELIVYGATESDAKITVQDRPINLRPDGTFTLRFALGDGKQVIPVRAVSAKNKEERLITPMVSRETKIG